MSLRNPYDVLGIGTGATGADITRAYRRLAREVHPDSRPGDPAAAAEFQAVSDAYGLLSDPARRAAYDHQHEAQPTWHRGSPGAPAAAGAALWPFPPAAVPGQAAGSVRGATLRAGPVRIEPAQPPLPAGSGGPESLGSPAVRAWLAYWLLADPRRRPW
jgi:curved DNA-binding protein CbpA